MNRIALALLVTLAAANAGGALARPVHLWSAGELAQKADLVIVATALSTRDTPGFAQKDSKADTWVPVETLFQVAAVLKGELKSRTATLPHYCYFGPEAEVAVIDGPSFVRFNPAARRQYLLFLKRAEDGALEPVSGQYDPDQSLKVLEEYHVSGER